MIIQCDHCSARFRMDDSKLANGPVKVRCAKCKEVFVVQPEAPSVAAAAAPPEPVSAPEIPLSRPQASTPPQTESAGAADFSFDSPDSAGDAFSQGAADFSFDVESPSLNKGAETGPADAADEFDWQGGESPSFDNSDVSTGFDPSSFDASITSSGSARTAAAVQSEDNDFDFGEVSLPTKSTPSPGAGDNQPADDFSMDFGDISFSDAAGADSDSAAPADVPGHAFAATSDAPVQSAVSSAADDFMLSFNADSAQQKPASTPAAEGGEKVNFGEFSFGEMDGAAAAAGSKQSLNLPDEAEEGLFAPGASHEFPEEDLPPSSLTSRKKSGSAFPLLVIFGAIILVIALAGSGIYFFGGPKAFSKVGLGFLVEWYGDKGGDEGSIALKNVTAAYTVNRNAGELFVVRGEAVNNFKNPRASVQVKVSLLAAGGAALVSKSAFCGNSLSNEQLVSLPLAKIEETMNNQFGDSLANLGLKPGATIPFVVVISPVPKEATDYTVQVGGSTVAAQ